MLLTEVKCLCVLLKFNVKFNGIFRLPGLDQDKDILVREPGLLADPVLENFSTKDNEEAYL